MTTRAPVAVGGSRMTWPELPERIRAAIEAAAGSQVTRASSQAGGFSPGLASVLTLADGRKIFVKAVSRSLNEFSADAIRRESATLPRLPASVPAPRLLASHDDGEWVALITEAVEGRTPEQPWRADERDRFLAATAELADLLTPSPIPAPSMATDEAGEFLGWTALATAGSALDRVDPWVRANLDRLIGLERQWSQAAAGTSLLHGDLRSDNFLLTADGYVLVDWTSVAVGAPWLDLALALPSVAMHGGGDPQRLWLGHPLSAGADPDAVDVVIAAAAGYFTYRSTEPHMPVLRAFQRAQGDVALSWLRERTGW